MSRRRKQEEDGRTATATAVAAFAAAVARVRQYSSAVVPCYRNTDVCEAVKDSALQAYGSGSIAIRRCGAGLGLRFWGVGLGFG